MWHCHRCNLISRTWVGGRQTHFKFTIDIALCQTSCPLRTVHFLFALSLCETSCQLRTLHIYICVMVTRPQTVWTVTFSCIDCYYHLHHSSRQTVAFSLVLPVRPPSDDSQMLARCPSKTSVRFRMGHLRITWQTVSREHQTSSNCLSGTVVYSIISSHKTIQNKLSVLHQHARTFAMTKRIHKQSILFIYLRTALFSDLKSVN